MLCSKVRHQQSQAACSQVAVRSLLTFPCPQVNNLLQLPGLLAGAQQFLAKMMAFVTALGGQSVKPPQLYLMNT